MNKPLTYCRTSRWVLLCFVLSALTVRCAHFAESPAAQQDSATALPSSAAVHPAAAAPLENTPWVLAAFSNPQLNSRLDVNLISIQFAIDGSVVSGKSACNDYFASYQAEGSHLTLSEIGTILMRCDDSRMALEEAYFESLKEVYGYQIEGETLTLTDDSGEMVLRFKVAPYSKSALFTRKELANAAYQSEFVEGGWLTLVNSEYRSTMKDSAAQVLVQLTYHMAFGDLDGDGVEEAAVVLVTSAGSSGIYYDLAIVKKGQTGLTNTAIARLGDRALVKDIAIDRGVIRVDMLVASSDHITCCPDAPVENQYRLEEGGLALIE